MGFLEKLIIGFTVISVLFVGGTVTLFSLYPPRSGIPKVAVDSEIATDDWLTTQRSRYAPKHGE